MNVLDELQEAVARVAERTTPAVVGIGGHWHRGSGVVVAKNRVLMNAHNVHDDGATCVFFDGRRERGRLLGEDMDGDLAVLDVDTAGIPPLSWAGDAAIPPWGRSCSRWPARATAGSGPPLGTCPAWRGPSAGPAGGSSAAASSIRHLWRPVPRAVRSWTRKAGCSG